MSKGFIAGGEGGSGGKVLSAIAVTYPEGSDCTITDGEKTIAAPDKSGQVVFNVKPGTWTVRSEDADSGSSKEQIVTVAAEGEYHAITISYRFYLFQAGVGSNISLTTGGGSFASIKISADNIHFDIGGYNGAAKVPYLYADEPVDVTDYSKMIIEGNSSGGNLSLTFGLSTSKGGTHAVSGTTANPFTSLSIDISSLTGDYYLVVHEKQIYVTERDLYVTNIYFE